MEQTQTENSAADGLSDLTEVLATEPRSICPDCCGTKAIVKRGDEFHCYLCDDDGMAANVELTSRPTPTERTK